MTITVTEKRNGFSMQFSAQTVRIPFAYTIRGTSDREAAFDALIDHITTTFGTIPVYRNYTVQSVSIESTDVDYWWDGDVEFGNSDGSQPPPEAGEDPEFSFDTTGGTAHVERSLSTVATYTPSGVIAANFQGLIGVTDSGIQGVDIVAPNRLRTFKMTLPATTVTEAYVQTLEDSTGCVNDSPWKGRQAGEVMFRGARGGRKGYFGDVSIEMIFSIEPNATGITIGNITGIDKQGHDYLWVRTVDDADDAANQRIKAPLQVNVERVSPRIDFSIFGLGT